MVNSDMPKGKDPKRIGSLIGNTDPMIGISVASRRKKTHSEDEISHTEWKEIHGEYVEVKICKPASAKNPIGMNKTRASLDSGSGWTSNLGFELSPPAPKALNFGFVNGSLPRVKNPQNERFKESIASSTNGITKPEDVSESDGD